MKNPNTKNTKNWALVLSGGGARGAYEIGVWKAMETLGLLPHLGAVTGASIGAINGAMMIQQLSETARLQPALPDLWQQAEPRQIFAALPDEERLNWRSYFRLALEFFSKGAIDVSPLRSFLAAYLDETAVRQAVPELGLTVYNWDKKQGESYFLNDIPDGQLLDYIMASATFPVFKRYRINGQAYFDGGIYNNLPLDLAMELPYIEKAIAVDVAFMAKHRPSQRRMEERYAEHTLVIRPSRMLSTPIYITPELVEKEIDLGFTDTLKAWEKVPHLHV